MKLQRIPLMIISLVLFSSLIFGMESQAFASPAILNGSSTNPTSITSGNVGEITVTTDKTSYNNGDTLTISGSVQDYISGTPVTIRIISPVGLITKVDQVDVGSDRTYSESISSSNINWSGAGAYQVKVQYGSADRTAQTAFQFTGISTTQTGNPIPTNTTPTSPLITVSIVKSSYYYGDTITVFGTVQQVVSGTPVSIQILDPSYNVAMMDQADVSQDGKYIISKTAAGPYWKLDGLYTIIVQYGPPNIKAETTFTFVTRNPYLQCPDCNDTSGIQQIPTTPHHNPNLECPDCNNTGNATQTPPPTPVPTPIPPTVSKIPHWVKTVFNLYGQGQISDDDLISALKFLIQTGVIKVS